MGKYIRTFFVSAVPGAMLGLVIYSIIENVSTVIACSFAGLVIAIATGIFYYSHIEH